MCSHSECCSPVINTVCRRHCRAPPGPRQRSTLSERHKLKERFKLTTHCGRASGVKPAPLAGADQTAGDNDFCLLSRQGRFGVVASSRPFIAPRRKPFPALLACSSETAVAVAVSRPDALGFVLRPRQESRPAVTRRQSPMIPGKRRNSPLFDPVQSLNREGQLCRHVVDSCQCEGFFQ